MPAHLNWLLERLRQYDELALCDLLKITSEDLLERFQDVIEEQYESLLEEMEMLTEDDLERDSCILYEGEEHDD